MSIAAALYDDVIAERTMHTLGNKLAALSGFSFDFSDEVVTKKSTVVSVGLGSGNAVVESPTDYEVGDSNIAEVEVTALEQSVSWNVTNADYNSTPVAKLESNLDDNLNSLGDALWDKCVALMNVANYGAFVVDGLASAFAASDMKTVWASLPKVNSRVCILDTVPYSNIMPTDKNGFELESAGAYGFNRIQHATKWDATGAQTGLHGFAGGKEAMAIAGRLPDLADSVREQAHEVREILLENLGLTVRYVRWGSTKTRKDWASVGLYFGAAVGQAAAGSIIGDTP